MTDMHTAIMRTEWPSKQCGEIGQPRKRPGGMHYGKGGWTPDRPTNPAIPPSA